MNSLRIWRYFRTVPLIVLAFAAILEGCDCSKSSGGLEPIPDWVCADNGYRPGTDEEGCPSGGRYAYGSCFEPRCDGEDGDSCCPGMLCVSGGLCIVPVAYRTDCTDDNDCDVEGQVCLNRPQISTESKTCGFPPVNEAGDCETGTAFNQRCITVAPCDGGCSEGAICNIDTNTCEQTPDLVTSDSCQQNCGDASILVYSNPDTMLFEQCCEISCECITLPPLQPGIFGRFSSMIYHDDELLVSSYDTTFGDLVVTAHNPATGARKTIEYVDGLPESGNPIADPEGPRAGLNTPGPDIGQHTSIASTETGMVVSYYDVDNKDLKFAQYDNTSQEWTTSSIHSGSGDIGRYTSLAVDANGRAHLAYYAHRTNYAITGEDGDGSQTTIATGVFYAQAKNPSPAGPSDWEIVAVEMVPSCHGSCTNAQECVELNGEPTCLPTASNCSNCAADQACVDNGAPSCEVSLPENLGIPCGGTCTESELCTQSASGASRCRSPSDDCANCAEGSACVELNEGASVCETTVNYPVSAGMPNGVGLFTSLALYNNRPIITYYDRTRRHLRGAQAQFEVGANDISAGFTTVILASEPNSDIGQHARLAVNKSQTEFSITYQALGGETLWLFQGTDILDVTGTTTLIDDGIRESQINLVGASSSPAYDADGNLFVAYADQTNNDLVLAYRTDEGWKNTVLIQEGAAGSFNSMVIEDGTAYVSTYLRLRDTRDRDSSLLAITNRDLDTLE